MKYFKNLFQSSRTFHKISMLLQVIDYEIKLVKYILFALITPILWLEICALFIGLNDNYFYRSLILFFAPTIVYTFELGMGVIPALILYYFWLCKYVMKFNVNMIFSVKAHTSLLKMGYWAFVAFCLIGIFFPFAFSSQVHQYYISNPNSVDYMQYYFFSVLYSAIFGTMLAMYSTKQFNTFQSFNRQ